MVPVTVKESGKDQPMKFRMRREEGQWRIYAFAVPLTPGGPEMNIDMEHPEAILGEAFKGMAESMAKGMKAMGEGMGAGMRAFGEGMKKGLNDPGAANPH